MEFKWKWQIFGYDLIWLEILYKLIDEYVLCKKNINIYIFFDNIFFSYSLKGPEHLQKTYSKKKNKSYAMPKKVSKT